MLPRLRLPLTRLLRLLLRLLTALLRLLLRLLTALLLLLLRPLTALLLLPPRLLLRLLPQRTTNPYGQKKFQDTAWPYGQAVFLFKRTEEDCRGLKRIIED